MAIRFVQQDPGAPTPGQAESEQDAPASEPDGRPERGFDPDAPAPEARGAPARGDVEAPPPATGPKPRARRKPAAPAVETAATAPPQDEAAPLLFPDLPLHPRPDRKGRRNRRGFG